MKAKCLLFLANLGQWLALLMLILATILMIEKNMEPVTTIVTCSSVLFAIATKAKYYRKKTECRKRIPISSLQRVKGRLVYETIRGIGDNRKGNRAS